MTHKFQFLVETCASVSELKMKHKVALNITVLLSARLLLLEQWFEIALAYRTVSGSGGYFVLHLIHWPMILNVVLNISVLFSYDS